MFDVPFEWNSDSRQWSQLLCLVSARLASDVEQPYMDRFPWDLGNLSVAFDVCTSLRALLSRLSSTSVLRCTNFFMLVVVRGLDF